MSRVKFNWEFNLGHVFVVASMVFGALAHGFIVYGKYKDLQFATQRNAEAILNYTQSSREHFEKIDLAISKLTDVSQDLQTEQARQRETIRILIPKTQRN